MEATTMFKVQTFVKKVAVSLFVISVLLLSLINFTMPATAVNTFTLDNPYSAGGSNVYKVQLHTHSTNSDGANTPEAVVNAYKTAGYNVIVISDHDFCTDDPGVADILFIRGVEETSTEGHINAINVTSQTALTNGQDIIDDIQSRGGIVQLNHPDGSVVNLDLTYEELDNLNNATLMEYNNIAYSMDKYDYMLSKGQRLWVTCTGDCHNVSNATWQLLYHIRVFADDLTEDDILNSISTGNFYASTGLLLNSITVVGNTETVEAAQASNFYWVKKNGQIIKTTLGVTSDSYTINGDEGYVRVYATASDDANKRAYVQPIFINNEYPEPAQYTDYAPVTDGLVAYYNGSTVTNKITDESGNGNNATFVNVQFPTLPSGSTVMRFDGTAYATAVTSESLNITGPYTLSVLVKANVGTMNVDSPGKYILAKGGLFTSNYALYYDGSNDRISAGYYNGAAFQTLTRSNIIYGYQYLTEVYDGTNLIIYRNGNGESFNVPTGTPALHSGVLYLGGYPNRLFNGDIVYAKVYNRALTPAEVTQDKLAESWRTNPEIQIEANASAIEGNDVTINVDLGYESADPIKVDYVTIPGSAVAGVDYTATSGTLTFAAGETTKNIVVHLLDDGEVSANKSFNVTLSNPVNTTLGANTTCVISEIEADTLTFTIEASSTTVIESDTTITLTITKNGITDYEETVNIATADGTALQPGDYSQISETLTFNNTTSIQTVVLSIKERNDITSYPKTFTVALSDPTNGAELGDPSSIEITILEYIPPSIASTNYMFSFFGSLLDGIVTLFPHFINLIMALIPLILISSIIILTIGIIYMIPKFLKNNFGKGD
jgi:hypothetical protein